MISLELLFISAFILEFAKSINGIFCQPKEIVYQYTTCDQNGERWRYALPRSKTVLCDNLPHPVPGLNCSFSCPAGTFLDLESQRCRDCPPGTFSLGDRVRYEQFTKWPPGFSIENFLDEALTSAGERTPQWDDDHVSLGWVVQYGEIRYLPTPCISRLTIQLNLLRDGFIEIHYKLPTNEHALIPLLQVRDSQCQSYESPSTLLFFAQQQKSPTSPAKTDSEWDVPLNSEYRARRIRIRAGQNVLTWTVATNQEFTTFADVIHVPKVDISGLGFAPSCSKCPPGTFFNSSGGHECISCPPGSHSKKWGATTCQPCRAADQYSNLQADKCLNRPKCESFDFHNIFGEDCTNGTTKIEREQIKPTICIAQNDVPLFKKKVSCSECPLGLHRSDDGICRRCSGENEYVPLGGSKCEKCSNGYTADHGIFITRWNQLPPELNTDCEYFALENIRECDIRPTWVLTGDSIESATSRATGVALELHADISNGFHNAFHVGVPTRENPIAHISVQFETRCSDETCQFYLIEETIANASASASQSSPTLTLLSSMNGTQKHSLWRHPILSEVPARFIFVFLRSNAGEGRDGIEDKAIIYSLNITNVAKGPAFRCVRCPRMVNNECLPCPQGHFFDQKICRICSPGSTMNFSAVSDSEENVPTCSPCPVFLEGGNDDSSACTFTGRFKLKNPTNNETLTFDMSPLRGLSLSAEGIKVFAHEGTSYFHIFNISLFEDSPVPCHETSLFLVNQDSNGNSQRNKKRKNDVLICRSAVVPMGNRIAPNNISNSNSSSMSKGESGMLYISSTILAQEIALVTLEKRFNDFVISNQQLEYESTLSASNRPLDVHFFFKPVQSSRGCPSGILTAVTVRCDPTYGKRPVAKLSSRCPDGTCDGCLFHVIVSSSYGCPVCRPEDFKEIRGECVDNEQKIHYIPSKHCVLSGAQARESKLKCSSASQMALVLAGLVIFVLFIIIVLIYQRNKSLEYRYMRLIEGGSKEGEHLSSSCALGDSDEENDADEEVTHFNNSNVPRVTFGRSKMKEKAPSSATTKLIVQNPGMDDDQADFFSEGSD